jgi:hypothetical protein
MPAVAECQADGDCRHHGADGQRGAVSSPAGEEKRTAGYTEEQTSDRTGERRQDRQP